MTVLSGQEIYKRIFSEEDAGKRLVISPLLDRMVQIQNGSSSIDVRLSNHFIVQNKTNITHLYQGESAYNLDSAENKIFIPFGERFVLHPNQFALGGTIEYVKMPLDLMGYLVGRSSWGRMGLIVATAVGIHPGYRGIITLELHNIGDVPFSIFPGRRIAQIFFHKVVGNVDKEGVKSNYICSVYPESGISIPDKEQDIIDRMGSS